MMSDPVIFKIIIHGKGGHASEPHRFNNPVMAGSLFLQEVSKMFDSIQKEGVLFTYCFPIFNSGTAHNVIPDVAHIEGMVRSL
jgi:amidohydrolase